MKSEYVAKFARRLYHTPFKIKICRSLWKHQKRMPIYTYKKKNIIETRVGEKIKRMAKVPAEIRSDRNGNIRKKDTSKYLEGMSVRIILTYNCVYIFVCVYRCTFVCVYVERPSAQTRERAFNWIRSVYPISELRATILIGVCLLIELHLMNRSVDGQRTRS